MPATRRAIGSQELLRRATQATLTGPGAVVVPVLVVGVVTGLAGIVILLVAGPLGSSHQPQLLAARALAAVVIGCGIAIAVLRRTGRGAGSGRVERDAATAGLLAVGALLPLLLIPVYLLARSGGAPSEQTVLYPYVDRRWLVAGFLLATLGGMVLVALMSRVVAAARTEPRSWWEWGRTVLAPGLEASSAAETEVRPRESAGRLALKLAGAAVLALYFFGPPWGIAENLRPIDAHETYQLGALQAISGGAVPYLGAASTQYGPGSQALSYLYMHHIGSASVVGFRESFALMHWAAATLFFAVLVVRLPFRLALTAIAVAVLLFPSLQKFGFTSSGITTSGTFDGFFGWFNALRYLGVFLAVMLLPLALRSRRRPALVGAALGVAWGVSCYIAQENLAAGAFGIVALTALMALSRTVTLGRAARTLAGLAAGFVAVWIVVLAAYAAQGELARFLDTYFLVAGAVTRGYSNTPFDQGPISAWGPLFYLLPAVLAGLGIAALLRGRPLRIATNWSGERVLLVSAIVAASACYPGALLRSDTSHLFNAILAVPVVLVLAIAYLPRLLAPGAPRRALAIRSAALAAGLALLIPVTQYARAPHRLVEPAVARAAFAGEHPTTAPTPAAERIGRGLAEAPTCCTSSLLPSGAPSMPRLVQFLDTLRGVVGSRRTYVAWGLGAAMPGLLYQGAGLREPPLWLEPGTLLVDQQQQRKFLAYFARHIREVDALVTIDTPTPEREIFTRAYPAHRTVGLGGLGVPVVVLIAR